MDNDPRIKTAPSRIALTTVIRSNTGETYPGYPQNASSPSYTKKYEWLKDSHGMKRYNPCEHYLRWCSMDRPFTDGSNSWYTTGNPAAGYWIINGIPTASLWGGYRYGSSADYDMVGRFGPWDQPLYGVPALYADDLSGRRLILPDGSDTKSLIDRSLRAMLPGIRPELSLLNTLYELRDIKTVARTLKRINDALDSVNRLKEAINLSKQALKLLSSRGKGAYARASLRSVLKAGSDMYLQGQFNVNPLLKDIMGVKSMMLNIRRQVNDLIANAGRLQTRHYRARISNLYPDKTETKTGNLPDYFVHLTSTGRREVRYPTCMFYATIEYRYKMPYPGGVEDYLPGAVLDAMGVNLNPAIIWNGIPWSFVVDWVVGVGRWLDQFKIRNIEPVTSISRYCFSYHIVREIKLSHGEDGNVVPFARFGEEAYHRQPYEPDWLYSIESSGLNPKEFGLAGALAASR